MHLTRTKLIHTVNADLTDLECKILRGVASSATLYSIIQIRSTTT